MQRPNFSEMLIARRRQLGYSLNDVANTLHVPVNDLQALEDGHFASLPSAQQTQGMLASYARYLSLNPAQVLDSFNKDQQAYAQLGPLAFTASDAQQSQTQTPRFGAGRNTQLKTAMPTSPIQTSQANISARYPQGRPYTHTVPEQPERKASSFSQPYTNQYGYANQYQQPSYQQNAYQQTNPYQTNQITTQPLNPYTYRDDLRYDDQVHTYHPASTQAGRENVVRTSAPQRPNVKRRQPSNRAREAEQRATSKPQNAKEFFVDLFNNPAKRTFLLIIMLAIVLIAIIIFGVTSCSSKEPENSTPVTVTAPATQQTQEEQNTQSTDDASEDENTNHTDAEQQDQATTQEVSVSVADGQISWLEITVDGESKIAKTVTGPWKQTYKPTKSMTIRAGKADNVQVMQNGKQITFDDKKASGLGTISIDVPQTQATATTTQDQNNSQNTTTNTNTTNATTANTRSQATGNTQTQSSAQ